MYIYVNGKLLEIKDNSKIIDAFVSLGLDTRNGVAVAVNNHVIPKLNWDVVVLQPDDKITVIKATQGG